MCFCFVLGYVCELFSELVGFLFGCYCSDMKSFPRQSRSCCEGIATTYKSILGSNNTFKTNFDFAHTSFDVVQASITFQNTLHFSACTNLHQADETILLTPCLLNSSLTFLITYTTSQDSFALLVT